MRVWLDPEKLKVRQLTTQDVLRVLREQNVQVAAGAVGQSPAPEGQSFQLNVQALGRLSTVEQFEQIIVKADEGTRVTYLKDIARVELGAQTYDQFALKNAQPSASWRFFNFLARIRWKWPTRCGRPSHASRRTFRRG